MQASVSSEGSRLKKRDIHHAWCRRELTLVKIPAVTCRYLETDDAITLSWVQTARQRQR